MKIEVLNMRGETVATFDSNDVPPPNAVIVIGDTKWRVEEARWNGLANCGWLSVELIVDSMT